MGEKKWANIGATTLPFRLVFLWLGGGGCGGQRPPRYGSGVFLVQKYIYIYLLFIKPLVLYCKSLERAFILHAKNPCFLFIYFREPSSALVAHQRCTSAPTNQRRTSNAKTA